MCIYIYIFSLLKATYCIKNYTKAHAPCVIYLGSHTRVNHRRTMSDVYRYV